MAGPAWADESVINLLSRAAVNPLMAKLVLASIFLLFSHTVLAINVCMSNSPLSMKPGIPAAMRSDSLGITRRSIFANIESITLTQSLIGLPVGAIAGIIGSMLGVGGGVIMVRT